ncbi:hypothetical protein RHDC4_02801 [Rhodocyclaceae bacterium]|nr:hypothetical protein RHDC4_02801 [Rhodocyclaceae bacterium]
MAGPLEHEVAYYFKDGKRCPIYARELNNSATWATAKSEALVDAMGNTLVPVNADTLHFRAPAESAARTTDRGENNPAHDDRVGALLKDLISRQTWKVETSGYIGRNQIQAELYDLAAPYQWDDEVIRIISSEAAVRHDLFGQVRELLDMSQRLPWVAIEVINTHYPEEKTFAGLRDLSKNMPLIVMFDFTQRPDHFLKINSQSGIITTKLYMRDGDVFNLTERLDIQNSGALATYVTNALRDLERIDKWKAEQSAKARKK